MAGLEVLGEHAGRDPVGVLGVVLQSPQGREAERAGGARLGLCLQVLASHVHVQLVLALET